MQINNYIIIGKIISPFGFNGELKLCSLTHPIENIFVYKKIYIIKKTIYRITINKVKTLKNIFVITIPGINNQIDAKKLEKSFVYLHKKSLNILKKQEYYWNDLLGLNVFDTKNEYYGKISNILTTKSYDILVIKKQNKIKFIPYVYKKYIMEINLKKKKMFITSIEDL